LLSREIVDNLSHPCLPHAAGAGAAVAVQQALVALAVRRQASAGGPDGPGVVDLLTLGRGTAGAVLAGLVASGVRDRGGLAGWTGFVALCGGSVLLDWLDGPIARRLGTSPAGAVYDLESDSWLTLAAGAAATAWGGLPAHCMAAPAVRYPLLARALRHLRYEEVFASEPRYARPAGIAQMLLFTAALAPFGGRATALAVRLAAPVVGPCTRSASEAEPAGRQQARHRRKGQVVEAVADRRLHRGEEQRGAHHRRETPRRQAGQRHADRDGDDQGDGGRVAPAQPGAQEEP
jgi:phosphatidylglycerophosphate synthase